MNWYKKSEQEIVNLDDLPDIEGYEDDKEIGRAAKYFNIGHGEYVSEFGFEPDFLIWILINGEIHKSNVFTYNKEEDRFVGEETHRMKWGNLEESNFKGRYEPQTGRLSVVKPFSQEFRDVPHVVINKIKQAFPRAKKIIVAKNKTISKKAQRIKDVYLKDIDSTYPIVKDQIDGLSIRKDIPNMSSISSSLDEYQIINGVRSIPTSSFNLTGKSYSVSECNRIDELAKRISFSKEINPLIVVLDAQGLYILEGGHRAEAIYKLGFKSFPAIVVVDESEANLL